VLPVVVGIQERAGPYVKVVVDKDILTEAYV